MEVLDRFNGNGNALSWLFRAERYFTYLGFAEKDWLPLPSFYLDGEALTWFNWLFRNEQFFDWTHFKEKLLMRFRQRTISASARMEVTSRAWVDHVSCATLILPATYVSPFAAPSRIPNFPESASTQILEVLETDSLLVDGDKSVAVVDKVFDETPQRIEQIASTEILSIDSEELFDTMKINSNSYAEKSEEDQRVYTKVEENSSDTANRIDKLAQMHIPHFLVPFPCWEYVVPENIVRTVEITHPFTDVIHLQIHNGPCLPKFFTVIHGTNSKISSWFDTGQLMLYMVLVYMGNKDIDSADNAIKLLNSHAKHDYNTYLDQWYNMGQRLTTSKFSLVSFLIILIYRYMYITFSWLDNWRPMFDEMIYNKLLTVFDSFIPPTIVYPSYSEMITVTAEFFHASSSALAIPFANVDASFPAYVGDILDTNSGYLLVFTSPLSSYVFATGWRAVVYAPHTIYNTDGQQSDTTAMDLRNLTLSNSAMGSRGARLNINNIFSQLFGRGSTHEEKVVRGVAALLDLEHHGQGIFQQKIEHVCYQLPIERLESEGFHIIVDVGKGMHDGLKITLCADCEPKIDSELDELKFFLCTALHDWFAREGNDLTDTIAMKFVQALAGF